MVRSILTSVAALTRRLTPGFLVGPVGGAGKRVSVLSPFRHRNLSATFTLFVTGDQYVLDRPSGLPEGREQDWDQEEFVRTLEAHHAPNSIDVLIVAGHATNGGPSILNSDTPEPLRQRIAARLAPGAMVVLWTCCGVHEGNRKLAEHLGATLLAHPGFTFTPGIDLLSVLLYGRWVTIRPGDVATAVASTQ